MTSLRLDKVALTSLVETYINYGTLKSTIAISGSVPASTTTNFSTTIAYDRDKTRADIYARNTTTGIKRPVTGGLRVTPYVAAGAETCNQFATYVANVITVTFSVVNNTGSPINLTTQDIEISAVLYQVPTST